MPKGAIIAVLLSVAAVCYQLYWLPVNITLDKEHQQTQKDDDMLYFWAGKRHSDFFQVGKTYRLEAGQQTLQLVLFSITYASLKPNAVKLGFRVSESREFDSVVAEYRVTELELSDIP